MMTLGEGIDIHFCLSPVDMRKSIDGLCSLVMDLLEQSPQSGHLFVFYYRSRDKVKSRYRDKNGFVMHYKRLEKGRFVEKQKQNLGCVRLAADHLINSVWFIVTIRRAGTRSPMGFKMGLKVIFTVTVIQLMIYCR